MKHPFLFLLPLLFLAQSCLMGQKGNGDITTDTRSVDDFTEIQVSGVFQVFLQPGEKNDLEIETDNNLIGLVESTVENGRLRLETKGNIRPTVLIAYITYTDLNRLDLSGAISVNTTDLLESDALSIGISGNADLEMDIVVDRLDVDISGNPSVELLGEADAVSLDMSGNGDLECGGLLAKTMEVAISGNGDAEVYATEQLTARISGNGSIDYFGNPETDYEISGNGSINKRD